MKNKEKCSVCKKWFDLSELYDYRGIIACAKHFDEAIEKRDMQRAEVMQATERSVSSQRNGEFVNNRAKYNLGNVANDGLPIMKIKEPQILQEYESRSL